MLLISKWGLLNNTPVDLVADPFIFLLLGPASDASAGLLRDFEPTDNQTMCDAEYIPDLKN